MAARSSAKFGRSGMISPQLRRAAKVAITEVLRARKGERVLIVTNPADEVMAISMALYDACVAAGAAPSLVVQPVKRQMDFADDAVILP
jgi:aminopeptidase